MMNYLFAGLVVVAALWGIISGNGAAVASSVLESGSSTVQLMLTLTGAMTVWSGIMAIAESSELTSHFTRLLRPIIRLIMPELRGNDEAEKYVCMNMVSNLLGLGNAATPLGLKAMKAMREASDSDCATPEMTTFAVINTASLQLVPSTLLVMRTEAGAENPMDIMPCVWITSAVSLCFGLTVCRTLLKFRKKEAKSPGKPWKLHHNSSGGRNRPVRSD